MSTTLNPNALFAQLKAYHPPRTATPVDLHLDGNEGTAPDAALLNEAAALGPEGLRRYPDARPLEAALATSVGAAPEQVIVTAGADDAIERLLRVFLAPDREMVLPVPTFEMIPRYAELTGARVVEVPWLEGALPRDAMLAAVTPATGVITVVTPNSPNGLAATAEDIRYLAERAPNVVLMVDLAYGEFADEDLLPTVLSLPNAVALRSFSKAWGMAGLRVGWAAGPARLIDWMRAAGHPYAVSSLSLALALRHLQTGRSAVDQFVRRVREQRTELHDLTHQLGGTTVPSQGNFQLVRFKDAEWVRDGLAGLGIAVRILPGKAHLENCLRVTVPGEEGAWARLRQALVTVVQPEVLVLPWRCLVSASSDQTLLSSAARQGAESLARRFQLVCSAVDAPAEVLQALRQASPAPWQVVTREQAPDPKKLFDVIRETTGKSALWTLAETEDHVRLARQNSVLPLGLVAEGQQDGAGRRLILAGACRLVVQLDEIKELRA
jgi:histidinol-phosphate aminotransferase